MTYQHGLPFNQRVERKDKVKPSPPGTANLKRKKKKKDFTVSHVRADKRVRQVVNL